MGEVGSIGSMKQSLINTFMSLKFDLGQNIVSGRSPPSLKLIVLARVTIALWQQNEIKEKILGSLVNDYTSDFFNLDVWSSIQKTVLHRAFTLAGCQLWKDEFQDMVKSVGGEIVRFLDSQYHFDQFLSNIKLYFDHIHWTDQGTINAYKSAASLLEHPDISTLEKYIIACNNCMEENVLELWEQLPEIFIEEEGLENERFRMVLFWTFHISGEQDKLSSFLSNKAEDEVTDIYTHLFEWAFCQRREVALQYFWKKFSNKEMQKSGICMMQAECVMLDPHSYNILWYLLSTLKEAQIKQVVGRQSFELLTLLVSNLRWCDVFFPVAQHVLQNFKTISRVQDALDILFIWKDNVFEKNQYKDIFIEFMSSFDREIKKKFYNIYFLHSKAIFSKNIMLIQLFLGKGTDKDKKQLVYDPVFLRYSESLLLDGRPDQLDVLVNELVKGKEVGKFFSAFMDRGGYDVCTDMIICGKYNAVDQFMRSIGDEAKNYKSQLLKQKGWFIFLKLKRKDDKVRFVSWCSDGDVNKFAYYNYIFQGKRLDANQDDGISSDVKGYLENYGMLVKHIVNRLT